MTPLGALTYRLWVKFTLNGETAEVPEPVSVRALLERFKLESRRVAVAVNTRVVPRSQFGVAIVREGDRVEVIRAVGGG